MNKITIMFLFFSFIHWSSFSYDYNDVIGLYSVSDEHSFIAIFPFDETEALLNTTQSDDYNKKELSRGKEFENQSEIFFKFFLLAVFYQSNNFKA